VEGFDAAAKAAILASIAFGSTVVAGDVYSEGISGVSPSDIESARELGYVVKLLALIEEVDEEIAVRVHPAMVSVNHPLAAVKDSFNAVFIEADAAGARRSHRRRPQPGRRQPGRHDGDGGPQTGPPHRRGGVAVLRHGRGGR